MKFPGIIYFFDSKIKPKILKGTQMLNPAPTGIINDEIRCIRQGDVNLWFYTKNNETIAIDTGHLNWPDARKDFEKISIDSNKINYVLLTHSDVDHCGGIDVKNKDMLYPNAEVFIGEREEAYLKHGLHRMIKLHKKIYNCVKLHEGYKLLQDDQIFYLNNIKIRAILIPGHTIGHMCYIVDNKYLFSGDCLAVNQDGGYAFWDFFCQYPKINKKSLLHLKEIVENSSVVAACTGHSGYIDNIDKLFAHIDESALFDRKKPFDVTAPKDVFKR